VAYVEDKENARTDSHVAVKMEFTGGFTNYSKATEMRQEGKNWRHEAHGDETQVQTRN
jgi:hypothetical protein